MTPVFVFRPEPGWTATAAAARKLGLDVRGEPLFEVEPVAWEAPREPSFDALLVGSANVFRHGGLALAALRNLPVYAVGDTTAEAAKEAGFAVTRTGQGGLQPLIDTLAGGDLSLLRLAGEEQVSLTVPPGIVIDMRVVYRTIARSLGHDSVLSLRGGGVALVHSAAAAAKLEAQCKANGIDRSVTALVTIGPRVSQACSAGWQSIHTAPAPTDADMLALAESLCQN